MGENCVGLNGSCTRGIGFERVAGKSDTEITGVLRMIAHRRPSRPISTSKIIVADGPNFSPAWCGGRAAS